MRRDTLFASPTPATDCMAQTDQALLDPFGLGYLIAALLLLSFFSFSALICYLFLEGQGSGMEGKGKKKCLFLFFFFVYLFGAGYFR